MPIVPATPDSIAEAAALLQAGRLVAMPTETVYGLAADATNGLAVAAIYAAKGRPRFNPLIVHVADTEAAHRLGRLEAAAERLADAGWPGPLTLVVPRREPSPISELATAGLDTVALRVPAHPVARALIAAAGRPLAAPSANRSGHVSPTTAAHVAADLGGRVAMILDGGPCRHGLESTIVAVANGRVVLLRHGAIPRADIERIAGVDVTAAAADDAASPASPGRLASHYAPRSALRLRATTVLPGEVLLAFGPGAPAAERMINLSQSGDLSEAAANLFGALRSLDAMGAPSIAVMAIPDTGLGEAINDRLTRAAAPRA
jgi:L-threonylcarbamoyladenylate synthase